MNNESHLLNFSQLDQISGGDINFKKELIDIFISQISEFTENMNDFLDKKDWESLAREAHTAKSSALIFGMTKTGDLLKQIQNLAEDKDISLLDSLVKQVETDLNTATAQLKEILKSL